MPADEAITEKGWEMLNDLPVVLRDDPDVRAVIHCYAREAERQEEYLRWVQRQFFPQQADELGLWIWEALLRTTIEPTGWTVEERREIVMALLRKLKKGTTGADWEAAITALVGSGNWSYAEHDPDDPSPDPEPPEYTVLVRLPFPADADRYRLIETAVRDLTPAHLDLIVTPQEGFILDRSRLDQDAFGS